MDVEGDLGHAEVEEDGEAGRAGGGEPEAGLPRHQRLPRRGVPLRRRRRRRCHRREGEGGACGRGLVRVSGKQRGVFGETRKKVLCGASCLLLPACSLLISAVPLDFGLMGSARPKRRDAESAVKDRVSDRKV